MWENPLLQSLCLLSKQRGGQVIPHQQHFLNYKQMSYIKHALLVS